METGPGIVHPKCATCRCYFVPTYMRNGNAKRTCERCLELAKIYKAKNKCPHGKEKCKCVECGGSQMCQHERQRCKCRECGGVSMCEHNRLRSECRECGNEIHKICIKMVSHSKSHDIQYNRFDEANFITYDFVRGLITQAGNKCHYCTEPIQYIHNQPDFGTIERLDNSIGHNMGNCVIACRTCNYSRVGDTINLVTKDT